MPRTSIALDSNLIVLLVIGTVRPSLIGRHRRLRSFELADHALLLNTIQSYAKISLTPNVVTEASNLIGHAEDSLSTDFALALRQLVLETAEVYVPSIEAAGYAEYLRLGITDSVLIRLARDGHTVITTDAPLCVAIWAAGEEAINFNHLREARLFT